MRIGLDVLDTEGPSPLTPSAAVAHDQGMQTNHRGMSRVLHVVGDATARSGVAAFVAVAVAAFLVGLGIAGFPAAWQTMFATVAASVTLVMVFVIQHAQSRQQVVTQLKLDELIRSSPQADDLLVHIETVHDDELLEREQDQIDHHTALREP